MAGAPDKTYRVLFVEDAFDQALLVKAFLSGMGNFSVTHSQDGDHALDLLATEEWHLVITDLNLPGTDGFDVIKAAREKDEDLPILASTGYTDSGYHDQAVRLGANDVMVKPLDKDDFERRVRTLLKIAPPKRAAAGPPILAVGGLAGDVEVACAGTLMQAVAKGRTVIVVPLCRDELDTTDAALNASREACKMLGLRVVIDEASLDDTRRRVAVMEKAIRELKPGELYLPSIDDDHPARMEAFRVAQSVSAGVDNIYAYQTGTTGPDFKPKRFIDVGDQMEKKTEALELFAGSGRRDLSPQLATANATYWGRGEGFTQVEAFEVIKGIA